MIKLNEVEIKLAEQLILTTLKKEPNITYKEMAERIKPPVHHRNLGKHLGKISELCAELGLPLLSAKVINTVSHKAGDGFYPLYKQFGIPTDGLSESQLFKRELQLIRDCKDWQVLSDNLGLDIHFDSINTVAALQKEIRLLPMSAEYEFQNMSYEEIQVKFFLDELIHKKNGYYNYRNSGINTAKGTLVLFQFENAIIASAELTKVEKYEKPLEGIYKGSYIFDTESIQVFEPITADELAEIDKDFSFFSRVKLKIDVSYQDKILALIKKKSQILIPEEIPENEIEKYPEGAKSQIIVNAYERNSKARQESIKLHGSNCGICGFDFGKIYGDEFAGKIHVHHVKPLNEINDNYEVDPQKDLIPVCPNCHMILHAKVGGVYTVQEVEKFIKKAK
ncbi:MAG: HNH endonuclease [Peptostreptococcaceae bacterium]|nr:HNH endonuclease [Peptostreptococcaceae bacterium]